MPGLIRLKENRATASAPLTPHPPCLLGLGVLGREATGIGEGKEGGEEISSGVPQGLLVVSVSGSNNFHGTGEHWHCCNLVVT